MRRAIVPRSTGAVPDWPRGQLALISLAVTVPALGQARDYLPHTGHTWGSLHPLGVPEKPGDSWWHRSLVHHIAAPGEQNLPLTFLGGPHTRC